MKKVKNLNAWFKASGAWKWARRHQFTERQFSPYVKAIGQLLLAWNDLHERLATLFVMAMGGGWVNRPLAIWHRTRSDINKREMLRAAIADMPDNEKAGRIKLIEEITYVLDTAKALEGFRDDAAHTPLYFYAPDLYSISNLYAVSDLYGSNEVFPNTSFQNPRAMRLDQKNKDMLTEFRYARERITTLRDYVIAIDAAWSNAQLPWPDRPVLPERKPKQVRQSRAGGRKSK